MEYSEIEAYALEKPHAVIDFPFDDKTPVVKVGGKMFFLGSLEGQPIRINLKASPSDVDIQRSLYAAIIPGYHMHKRHWNSIILDGTVPPELIRKMVDDSYELVWKGLTKALKISLQDS